MINAVTMNRARITQSFEDVFILTSSLSKHILFPFQAKNSYDSGDVVKGRRKADMAKLLVIITVCIGMLIWVVGIIALVLVVAT